MFRSFEKFSAIFFVLVLVTLVLILTFEPINDKSKEAVLMVVGALTTTSATTLPKLFSFESKFKALNLELESLRQELKEKNARYDTLKEEHDKIVEKLIKKYIDD